MWRELASIGCLVFSLRVKEELNNGQGANTFGRLIDLDRLLSLFPSKSTKIKKPTKSRTLAMGFGFFIVAMVCEKILGGVDMYNNSY
jgi:hypothetical protein